MKNKLTHILLYLYIILFSLFYLIEPIRLLFLNEKSQTLNNIYGFILITILLLILLLIYFLLYKKIKKIDFRKVFIISLLINLILFLIYPIASTDIFSYISQTRVWTVFNKSPYLFNYLEFDNDKFFYFLQNSWSNFTSPYGPLFLLIKSFFTYIFSNNVLLNIYSVKLFFIIINIINGLLIYKISNNKIAFYLYAFNPLILFEFIINVHNEVLIVFFILLFYLYSNNIEVKNKLKAFSFLTLSIFIKFITLIILPIYVLLIFLKEKYLQKKIYILGSFLFIFTLFGFIFFYPFINSFLDILNIVINQSNKIHHFTSPMIIILFFLINLFVNISLGDVVNISRIIFIIFYIITMLDIIINRSIYIKNYFNSLVYLSGLVYLVFLFSFFGWFLPWYLTPIIAIFSLLYGIDYKKRSVSLFIILFSSLYGIIFYFFVT